MCGLKLKINIGAYHINNVTPFVGVWIETIRWLKSQPSTAVTPFVGVWIETADETNGLPPHRGHTLRGCVDWNSILVLKSFPKPCHTLRGCVDWNCQIISAISYSLLSHPLWVCGLKHWNQDRADRWHVSHPSWVCGLKRKAHEELQRQGRSHPSWVCGLKHTLLNPSLTL